MSITNMQSWFTESPLSFIREKRKKSVLFHMSIYFLLFFITIQSVYWLLYIIYLISKSQSVCYEATTEHEIDLSLYLTIFILLGSEWSRWHEFMIRVLSNQFLAWNITFVIITTTKQTNNKNISKIIMSERLWSWYMNTKIFLVLK